MTTSNTCFQYFLTFEAAEAEIKHHIAKAHFGGTPTNKMNYIKKEKNRSRVNPEDEFRWMRKYRCYFFNSTRKCPGELRIRKKSVHDEALQRNVDHYFIQLGNVQHVAHDGTKARGLTPAVKAAVFNSIPYL